MQVVSLSLKNHLRPEEKFHSVYELVDVKTEMMVTIV